MPTVKVTRADAEKYLKDFDWTEIDAMTDEDIARQIAANPDAVRELGPDFFQHADRMEGARVVRRGRPRKDQAAVKVTVTTTTSDVASIRGRLGMTQAEFARAYRFSVAAIRDLEQGRRKAVGSTATLLELIADNPEYVRERLAARIARKIVRRGRAKPAAPVHKPRAANKRT